MIPVRVFNYFDDLEEAQILPGRAAALMVVARLRPLGWVALRSSAS